jgi:hypothetical protein
MSNCVGLSGLGLPADRALAGAASRHRALIGRLRRKAAQDSVSSLFARFDPFGAGSASATISSATL